MVVLQVVGMLLAFTTGAAALNPTLDIRQYAHTAWSARDGFGGGRIEAIAQTTDGYLWIGTDSGLFRFDGLTMVRWLPRAAATSIGITSVRGLLGARDGTLWISADDGVMTLKGGQLTVVATPRGRRFSSIAEDRDGGIWIGSTATGFYMCHVVGSAIDCFGLPTAYGPPTGVLFTDAAGQVWTGFDRGIARLKPAPAQWFPLPSQLNGYKGLAEDETLLVGVPEGMARLASGKTELAHPAPAAVRPLPPVAVLRDRDGVLWMATYGRGIWRVGPGRSDVFTAAEGLSGDGANLLFEDREGSIWVATDDGLDRFRDVPVPTVSARRTFSNGTVSTVLAAADGSLWLATLDGLNHWAGDRLTVYREQNRPVPPGARRVVVGGFPERSQSLLQDRAGRIWVSDRRAAGYLDGDRFVPVFRGVDVLVLFMVEDRQGDIWISTRSQLARVRHDRVIEVRRWTELGRSSYGTAALIDPREGGLWLGLFEGGLIYYRHHRVERGYGSADGLGAGIVNHLRADADGAIWAATQGGLSRIKDGHVATLGVADGLPCDSVHWSMADGAESVWLYTTCGLIRVPAADVDGWAAAADSPGRRPRIRFTLFDSADGVRMLARPTRYHPQVTRAPDGRIWFSTLDGVAIIDQRNIRVNRLAPPVHIEQVVADRRRYDAAPGLRLPPRVRDLQIDYTALSLVAPERNRFRVMLEGRDPDWLDVGARRQAFYTDLPPGSYSFRVQGSNNSGVWNETGASLEIAITPAYYQTRRFQALAACSGFAVLWVGYLVRVRHITRDYQHRLEERVNERTRIARDLHDTLLQGLHGLLLRFQTASCLLPDRPAEAKAHLDGAIRQAAKAITDGRDAVQGLRSSTIEGNDLAEAIRALGEELSPHVSDAAAPVFEVAVAGRTCELHPIVRDEIYKIAAEALRNAFRHAAARRVEVEIRYGNGEFRLCVRDDGKGIDPKLLADQGLEGHYGLRGMPERAALIGGRLAVWSETGAGTEVVLRVPGDRIYAAWRRRSWIARWFASAPEAHSHRVGADDRAPSPAERRSTDTMNRPPDPVLRFPRPNGGCGAGPGFS